MSGSSNKWYTLFSLDLEPLERTTSSFSSPGLDPRRESLLEVKGLDPSHSSPIKRAHPSTGHVARPRTGSMIRPFPWGLLPLGNPPVPYFGRLVTLGSRSLTITGINSQEAVFKAP